MKWQPKILKVLVSSLFSDREELVRLDAQIACPDSVMRELKRQREATARRIEHLTTTLETVDVDEVMRQMENGEI